MDFHYPIGHGHLFKRSVLEEVKEGLHGKELSSGQVTMPVDLIGHAPSPPRPHAAGHFASAGDADNYEYFGWGEVVGFGRAKCPELRAAKLMPTSLPIVHLVVCLIFAPYAKLMYFTVIPI